MADGTQQARAVNAQRTTLVNIIQTGSKAAKYYYKQNYGKYENCNFLPGGMGSWKN